MRDSKRDTDVQNSLMDSVGEGEGGKIWENGIEKKKKEKKNTCFGSVIMLIRIYPEGE